MYHGSPIAQLKRKNVILFSESLSQDKAFFLGESILIATAIISLPNYVSHFCHELRPDTLKEKTRHREVLKFTFTISTRGDLQVTLHKEKGRNSEL